MSKHKKMISGLRHNYTYTTSQLQQQFGIHPHTVRRWVKDSNFPNPPIQPRPLMVFSEDLRAYLRTKEQARKTSLQATEFYCMGCKAAKQAEGNQVYVETIKLTTRLKAVCPSCGAFMNKAQSISKLDSVTPFFKRINTLAELHILSRATRSEKAHLGGIVTSHPNEPSTDTHLLQQASLF
ncbi:MAG: hypothetical protein GC134_04125 [Proteobacteria bacterium]|nr:hypothetical protein [Pseudomonadota bacterium]